MEIKASLLEKVLEHERNLPPVLRDDIERRVKSRRLREAERSRLNRARIRGGMP
jgi:hypothetical protein